METPEASQRKTRILVADDHPLMRDSVVRLIERCGDLTCCAETGTVAETLEAVARHRPDMIILDLRLKTGDGIELIKSLKARDPGLRVLVFSQFDTLVYAERALRAGAMGYVIKDQPADELIEAVRSVLAGRVYLTRALAAVILKRFVGSSSKKQMDGHALTDRELHVLELLGGGMSTRQVAATLNLSFKTIETHRENIKRKLGLRTAAALTHYAVEWARKPYSPGDTGLPVPPTDAAMKGLPANPGLQL
jgi:DNA-binding NarL/FixJ family response regulator